MEVEDDVIDAEHDDYDESVYELLQNFTPSSSCLSFSIIPDNLGDKRTEFPFTGYVVAGTQAPQYNKNSVMVIKMDNLHKTQKIPKNESESESEDEDINEIEKKTPKFEAASIHHEGGVNRIKVTQLGENLIAATWSESKRVHLWNVNKALHAVNDSRYMHKYKDDNLERTTKPILTFGGHMEEGFAMDWSSVIPGRLATGDNKGSIHLWNPKENTSWHIDQRPYTSHTQSIEDLQWSPSEGDVFASCSVDGSIKIWDARAKPSEACMLTASKAHDSDVNVISWNGKEQCFIVSGGDDGSLKIWDLREFKEGKPMALFKHHTAPITSVEWNPNDSSVFAACGADDQLTIWDLSLERDYESQEALKENEAIENEIPPYILFVHKGQNDIKELHWHPQIPGLIIDTAFTGFNIIKTINV